MIEEIDDGQPFMDYMEGVRRILGINKIKNIDDLLNVLESYQLFEQYGIVKGYKDRFTECVKEEYNVTNSEIRQEP